MMLKIIDNLPKYPISNWLTMGNALGGGSYRVSSDIWAYVIKYYTDMTERSSLYFGNDANG